MHLHECALVRLVITDIKKSQVLCLDECTANVDTKTASILQSTIFSECRAMTVITIAHRISTVLNMDNILVLDRGNLVRLFSVSFLRNSHAVFCLTYILIILRLILIGVLIVSQHCQYLFFNIYEEFLNIYFSDFVG